MEIGPSSQNVDVIEKFHGVYLLYCTNPKYLGRVYIGYTVDPNRRIKQHNKGKRYGGAWKTSNRGPWVMVMVIHGFPNDISALRFEWAWQHPQSSRRLQHVTKKKNKEKVFDFSLRVLAEMLQVGPWKRLPLTIRWLNEDYARVLLTPPPMHMPICNGPVISKKLPAAPARGEGPSKSAGPTSWGTAKCDLCRGPIDDAGKQMTCLMPDCPLRAHVICLSKHFFQGRSCDYIPIDGRCPSCANTFLWGDIVRKFKGCYSTSDFTIQVQEFL